MRRRVITCLAAAALLTTACRNVEETQPRPVVRIFRLGGNQALTDALAAEYTEKLRYVEVRLNETAITSFQAIDAIQDGTADAGIVSADAGYLASIGQLPTRAPAAQLRGIALLQITALHVLAAGNSTIETLADLRGKRVRMGPRNPPGPINDTSLVADLTLRAFNLHSQDMSPVTMPLAESLTQVVDGRLDAAFVNASYPFDTIRPTLESGARLIAITGGATSTLVERYPFIRTVTIPAGTYPGQRAALDTVGVNVVLVCSAALDEAVVYDLTRTFFDALPHLAAGHAALRLMDPEQAPATLIPLHDGAARYYRELELFR